MKTKNELEHRLDKLAPIESSKDLNETYRMRVKDLYDNKAELIKDPNYQQVFDTNYGIYWTTLRGRENEYGHKVIDMYKNKELKGLGCVL
jgi:hypothetical protein